MWTPALGRIKMKYKRTLFGKIKKINNEAKKKNFDPTREQNIKVLFCLSGVFLIYNFYLFLEGFLKIPLNFGKNKFFIIFMILVFPWIFGYLSVKFIAPLLESINHKLPLVWAIFIFIIFGLQIWYLKNN